MALLLSFKGPVFITVTVVAAAYALSTARPGGEMADAEGLNPSDSKGSYGFDPRPGHL